ncbi:paraquat-inducible protein A [Craurococcus roseus]|uniref:paraquat-inducible protein A n=1 Tax=Craurococcus roseus TaxID=77585 RepID=UPI0031DB1774
MPGFRECHDCGKLLRMPPFRPGADVCCPRCDAVLRRGRERPLGTALALGLACLPLYGVAVLAPFLGLALLGQGRDSRVGTGAIGFAQDGFWPLSAVVALCVVALPLLRILLRLAVLCGLRLRRPPARLPVLFRWHERLGPWAMPEVFLFGALVSYTRLVDLAAVEIGPAAYGLGLLVLALAAADATFAPQAVWEALERRGRTKAAREKEPAGPGEAAETGAAPGSRRVGCRCCHLLCEAEPGQRCPRCGDALHRRKRDSAARCWALVLAAAILYVPANWFPVMEIVSFGRGGPHTILGGVVEFVETGFWPLALIVFLASVAVPLLKLAGLAAMLLGVRRRYAGGLRARTRLYRFIEAIGRWSMIDVFVVAVLVALVRFGALASISSEVGAACFAAVVVLTMLAAEAFDPRLMWDAAEGPAGPPEGAGR